MAEGDTVHVTAARLRERFEGRVLSRTDLRVPRFATADLSGRSLTEIAARGKHLLMRTDGGETIHSHLGMDGAWTIHPIGDRPGRNAIDVRAILEVDGWVAIARRMRKLEVVVTDRESSVLGDLGPDPLGPDWDAAEAVRRLVEAPDRPIGEALLDQRVMAGPGNVYRSEACFLAGIDPRSPVRDVADPANVVELTRSLMERNRDGGRRSTTGDRRRGHELWVYGRAGHPCRRCGTRIQRIQLAARVAYVCPRCERSERAASTHAR